MKPLIGELRIGASVGSRCATYLLGLCYEWGFGVRRNQRTAFRWHKAAADLGNVEAQFEVAMRYEHGVGVRKSANSARAWYERCAMTGMSEAQFNLGVLCESGQGGKKSEAEAIKWHKMAADQGSVPAHFRLGLLFAQSKKRLLAKRHFLVAAKAGHADAQYNLALMYDAEATLASSKEAFKWYQSAHKHGLSEATTNMAIAMLDGCGTKRRPLKAVAHLRKAAAMGDPKGLFNLGKCFDEGVGVAMDIASAMEYYIRAAALGNRCANQRLAEKRLVKALREQMASEIVEVSDAGGGGIHP